MDIEFGCTKCGQHLVIDAAGAGQAVNCPKCGQVLIVPSQVKYRDESSVALQQSTDARGKPTNLLHCPDCQREVSKQAATCPHCGKPLGESDKRILSALLLLFFFGIFGAHAFYAGRLRRGVLYLVWFIGFLVSLWLYGIAITREAGPEIDVLPFFVAACVVCFAVFMIGDFIRILAGAFKDGQGRKIARWV